MAMLILMFGLVWLNSILKELNMYLEIASIQLHTTPKAILKKVISKA